MRFETSYGKGVNTLEEFAAESMNDVKPAAASFALEVRRFEGLASEA